MEYYKEKYEIAKNIFTEDMKFSWNINNNKLALYSNKKPLGIFKFKKIASMCDENWVWCFNDKENYIDKVHYPHSLKKLLTDDIINSKDQLTKIVYSLKALNGEWYAYLVDENCTHIVILIKTLNFY
jgi:hypothetical protein